MSSPRSKYQTSRTRRPQSSDLYVAQPQRRLGGEFSRSRRSPREAWQRRRRIGQAIRLSIVVAAVLAILAVIIMALSWVVAQASILLLDERTSPPVVMTEGVVDVNDMNTPGLYGAPFTFHPGRFVPILPLSEDVALKGELEAVFNTFDLNRFTPHVFVYDLSNYRYTEIGGYEPVSAASVIKLPLLWLLFEDMDAGYFDREDPMLYLDYHRSGGAGTWQYRDANIAIPTYDVARQMIQVSDNTATNMVLDKLGGAAAVNSRWATLGLKGTWVNNLLPDLDGTNHVTMYDLSTVCYNLYMGGLLSENARDDMLTILSGTHNRRLIPALLPDDTLIYHKTGDIGTALADAGIIQLPDGRAYIMAIQVDRPFNDYTARDMIQKASEVVYQHALRQPLM